MDLLQTTTGSPWSGIEHNALECGDCKTFLPFITCDLSFTEIRYLAGDLRNVALSFLGTTDTRALNFPSNDPRFKQLEKFLNNIRISIPASNRRRTNSQSSSKIWRQNIV